MAKRRAERIGDTPQFRRLPLGEGLAGKMQAALEEQGHLHFTVKWQQSRPLVLMSLQISVGDQPAIELLQHPLGNNTGELTADMGVFTAGELNISFLIGALADIKQAATFIVEDTTHVSAFKPGSGDGPKSLKSGETWADGGTFKVGATS